MTRGLFHRRNRTRQGTTIVETALVLPVFLFFVLGIIEFGHAIMVTHVLNSACRQAARIGSTAGNSTATVRAKVLSVLGSAVNQNKVTVYVKDAGVFDTSSNPSTSASSLESMANIELSNTDSRHLFMVRAKLNYKDVAIVPDIPLMGSLLNNLTIQGQAFMRHE